MAFFLKIIGTCSPGGAHDWFGWEAALIQHIERGSKQKNPPTDLDGLFDEDSGRKKVKSDGHYTAEFMGNDSARLSTESASIPYGPSGESMADHALQYGHWSVALKLDGSRSEHVAKVVGGLADEVKRDITWKPIEESLSKEMCSKLKESVFSGIAKFILSIFDVEDFTKDIVSDDRKANFMKLARKLMAPDKADTFREKQKQKFKDGREARKYIAEEINLDFKGLNEIDVSFLIGYCNLEAYDEKVVQDGLKQLCPRRNSGEFKVALKQMEGYVPLKAALIQHKERGSKPKNPPTDLDGLFDEDSGRKKVKSDGHYTAEFMGNDSARLSTESASIPYGPSGESMADHALQSGHWSVAVKLDSSRSEHVAEVVGGLADKVKRDISWKPIEESLSKEICSKLKERVFSGIAKFILSIFDVEDFTKDIVSDDRKANFMKLARKLMVPDKNRNEATKYIAEEINLDFKGLNEIDVCFLLGYCNLEAYDEKVVQDGLKQLCPRRNSGEFKVALKQMEGYVPLKEEYKMQLFLEMVTYRHCHIIDYLFVEVCQGFVTHELAEALDKDGLPRLTELVREVWQAIVQLVEFKMGALNCSRLRAGYPLHGGMFGKFDDEVFEVIRIADYERRIQGHPFIGVYHILFSLRFSRVGLHPLVEHGFNKSSAEKLPEAPPYKIYKLAGEYAESCGGDKIVKLEHLALAVIGVQEGRTTVDPQQDWKVDLDELARSNYKFPGYVFKEVGLRDASNNPIEGLGKLVKAIKEGLKIPEIRECGHWTK